MRNIPTISCDFVQSEVILACNEMQMSRLAQDDHKAAIHQYRLKRFIKDKFAYLSSNTLLIPRSASTHASYILFNYVYFAWQNAAFHHCAIILRICKEQIRRTSSAPVHQESFVLLSLIKDSRAGVASGVFYFAIFGAGAI